MKNNPIIQKIKSREEAAACVKQWQNEGEKVGFTSGSFDLLHLGHIEYLEEASRHCDRLVVAINSDLSVRAYKGPKRPICDERSRLHVIASLSSVDLVFLFDETNNNTNVKVLRPDLYIKAGDYNKSRMTSAGVVESQGGKVLIVPFATGYSSSGIIEKILEVYGDEQPKSAPELHYERAPAIFIDRDGTINEEFDYIDDPKLFELIPGAMEAIHSLGSAGYRIVIVTNQPGIGFGYYSKQDFFRVNKKMLEAASAAGVVVHKIYYCPHTKAENCNCRKPLPHFANRAKEELNIDLSRSFMIGDRGGDIMFGKNSGMRTVLVRTGAGSDTESSDVKPDYVVDNIKEAARLILSLSPSRDALY